MFYSFIFLGETFKILQDRTKIDQSNKSTDKGFFKSIIPKRKETENR